MLHPLPHIIAHRGASLEAPENTLSSIKRALALNSHYVEMDVRLSKEGVPILLHDDSAARMLGSSYSPFVHDLTLPQIQAIDIGQFFHPRFAGEKVPTLAQALELDWGKTGLMLEIKECYESPRIVVKEIFHVLEQSHTLPSSLIIGSFAPSIIMEIKKYQNSLPIPIRIIGIIEESEMLAPFLKLDIPSLALWHPLINAQLMQQLHSLNFEAWTFTIDDFAMAKSLVSLGIRGIISNDPQLMLKEFHKDQPGDLGA